MTNQTIRSILLAMFSTQMGRLLHAYPAIYLACHRRHIRDDEGGAVVTAHQASVLDHLDVHRATTLSRLAEHMGIGRSAMSIEVNRLVHRGYVRRRPAREDGRKVSLTLTAAGNRIREQNTVLDPDLVREMFALIPPSELESGLDGIECLAKYAMMLVRHRKRRQNA